MSIAQWILVVNFFVDGKLPEKIDRLLKNKAILVLIGIYLIHVLGLLWTSDTEYALKDLRVKLPLLIIPFIMAAEPLISKKRFNWVLTTHALGVFAGSMVILYGLVIKHISDPRDASILISHIRFGLNICVAIFTMTWIAWHERETSLWIRILRGILLLWLIVFLFILESFTGLAVFAITAIITLLRFGLKGKSNQVKLFTGTAITVSMLGAIFWLANFYQHNIKRDPVNPDLLEYYTPAGKPYTHNINNDQVENGHYLWLYVCYDELMPAWNSRSAFPFDSLDGSGQPLHYTLVRFLSSKGLRKDKEGMNSLSDAEVHAIEQGIANVKDLHDPGFQRRIENVLWEVDDYRHTGDPTNHSLMQRVALWYTSLQIINQHPVKGVGTGDVPYAFKTALDQSSSPLKNAGMRTHNQYLTIAVALGIPALLYFLFALFYAPYKHKKFNDFFFYSFMIIALLSMLTEDTLESQPGVSFFIFFYILLLLGFNNPEANTQIQVPGNMQDKDVAGK